MEEVLFRSEKEDSMSDNMPASTCLKYNRFWGDGSQDVDDWFCEFESIALANQEDLEANQRIFQGLVIEKALKWYQDVSDWNRNDWDEFISLFLRTFRDTRGEARALGCLSWMTLKTFESVQKYRQRVKALIQKPTTEIAPSVQVEWYVAGFLEEIGFQIWQTRPAMLRDAMEAAQNYENSTQSLQKSLKRSERKGMKHYRMEKRRRKHFKSNNSSSSNGSDTATSNSESLESDLRTRTKNRNRGHSSVQERKGKSIVKIKTEEDESRKWWRISKNCWKPLM